MLFKQKITPRVVISYISNTRNRFSLIVPVLTAFSLVFKPKPYFNIGGKFIFSTGLFYSTSRKNISKSSDFFQKVYTKLVQCVKAGGL